LAQQLEADALADAQATALQLLELNPDDQDVPAVLAYLSDRLDHPDQVGELRTLTGHRAPVNCVAFAPDGRRGFSGCGGEFVDGIYTDGEDRSLLVWDLAEGQAKGRFEEGDRPILSVACAPSGTHVLTASRSGQLFFIDTRDPTIFRALARHRQIVFDVAFAPDGRRFLTGCDDGVVRLWGLRGERLRRFGGHSGAVTAIAFSPDGSRAVSGSLDGTVRLWDVESGALLHCLQGHEKGVLCVAFAPSGEQVASGSADATVRLWDVGSGTEVHCLRGHRAAVAGVAFTPDGRRVLSGGDQTVRLWATDVGTELHCFNGHTGTVKCVAVSPGGRRALSGGTDQTVRLWGLPADAPA
jgi:WD40 repeat protein